MPRTDFFADLADAPRLSELAVALTEIDHVLCDDRGFSPAHTVEATHLALLGSVHLCDTAQHAADLHSRADLLRLLSGLNLLLAYLTQTIEHLAVQTASRTFADLPAQSAAVDAVTRSLHAASASGAVVAGHLLHAHTDLGSCSR